MNNIHNIDLSFFFCIKMDIDNGSIITKKEELDIGLKNWL